MDQFQMGQQLLMSFPVKDVVGHVEGLLVGNS